MEEIINNIMQTPDNTNPNVLRSQLQGMLSGSTGGVLVVHIDRFNHTLDKTWQEIHDAPFAVVKFEDSGTLYNGYIMRVFETFEDPKKWGVILKGIDNSEDGYEFIADSEDGYPHQGLAPLTFPVQSEQFHPAK